MAAQVVLDRPWVFIDNVNLFLHEGGHFVFRVFGQTIHILGGTVGQLAFPLAFALYFALKRRDRFATLVMVFWVGQNLIGISRYMADAVDMALPLVGGEIHDWNWLLRGRLSWASGLARATWLLGALAELAALGWMVWLTVRPKDQDLTRQIAA